MDVHVETIERTDAYLDAWSGVSWGCGFGFAEGNGRSKRVLIGLGGDRSDTEGAELAEDLKLATDATLLAFDAVADSGVCCTIGNSTALDGCSRGVKNSSSISSAIADTSRFLLIQVRPLANPPQLRRSEGRLDGLVAVVARQSKVILRTRSLMSSC